MSANLMKVLNCSETGIVARPHESLEATSLALEALLAGVHEVSSESLVVSTEGFVEMMSSFYKKIVEILRKIANIIVKFFGFERDNRKQREAEMKRQKQEASRDAIDHLYSVDHVKRLVKALSVRGQILTFSSDHYTSSEMIEILSKGVDVLLTQAKSDFAFLADLAKAADEETDYFIGLPKSNSFYIANSVNHGAAQWNQMFDKFKKTVRDSPYFTYLTGPEFNGTSPTVLTGALRRQLDKVYSPDLAADKFLPISVKDNSSEAEYVDKRAALVKKIEDFKDGDATKVFEKIRFAIETKLDVLKTANQHIADLLRKNPQLGVSSRTNFANMRHEVTNMVSLLGSLVGLGMLVYGHLDHSAIAITSMGKNVRKDKKKQP